MKLGQMIRRGDKKVVTDINSLRDWNPHFRSTGGLNADRPANQPFCERKL